MFTWDRPRGRPRTSCKIYYICLIWPGKALRIPPRGSWNALPSGEGQMDVYHYCDQTCGICDSSILLLLPFHKHKRDKLELSHPSRLPYSSPPAWLLVCMVDARSRILNTRTKNTSSVCTVASKLALNEAKLVDFAQFLLVHVNSVCSMSLYDRFSST